MQLSQFKHVISIDLETTGIDPVKNGVISFGAATIEGNHQFYVENYLRRGVEIDPKALEVNGESAAKLLKRNKEEYASEWEALQALINFANRYDTHIICGKNPDFDYKFLMEIWKRNGKNEKDFPFSYRKIDVGGLCLYKIIQEGHSIPKEGASSSFIQEKLKLQEEPKPHNALTGAIYNRLYIKKVFGLC